MLCLASIRRSLSLKQPRPTSRRRRGCEGNFSRALEIAHYHFARRRPLKHGRDARARPLGDGRNDVRANTPSHSDLRPAGRAGSLHYPRLHFRLPPHRPATQTASSFDGAVHARSDDHPASHHGANFAPPSRRGRLVAGKRAAKFSVTHTASAVVKLFNPISFCTGRSASIQKRMCSSSVTPNSATP
jgi:hypothetical protein